MSLRKAAEDLLEGVEAAIKAGDWKVDGACDPDSAIVRLRQALAQPVDAVNISQERVDETAKHEQEPVGYVTIENISSWAQVPSIKWFKKPTEGPLYTAPPKLEWVGLTDEEAESWRGNYDFFDSALVREVEAKLKEKNT